MSLQSGFLDSWPTIDQAQCPPYSKAHVGIASHWRNIPRQREHQLLWSIISHGRVSLCEAPRYYTALINTSYREALSLSLLLSGDVSLSIEPSNDYTAHRLGNGPDLDRSRTRSVCSRRRNDVNPSECCIEAALLNSSRKWWLCNQRSAAALAAVQVWVSTNRAPFYLTNYSALLIF